MKKTTLSETSQMVGNLEKICSITGKSYYGYGNNAYPFDGICSDEANSLYVIPVRIAGVTPEQIKAFGGNEAFAKTMASMFHYALKNFELEN